MEKTNLDLKKSLLKGFKEYGYGKLSPNQHKLIKQFTLGDDLIVKAMSEPEIMAAYCLGILEQLDDNNIPKLQQQCQCVVFAPNKCYIDDIVGVLSSLGKYLGVHVRKCTEVDSSDIDVVVGTDEEVLDLLKKRERFYDSVKLVVLDVADIFPRFNDDVKRIKYFLQSLPHKNNVQMCVIYEEMPPAIYAMVKTMLRNPYEMEIPSKMLTLNGIKKHQFVEFERRNIIPDCEVLCNKIIKETHGTGAHTIIFVRNCKDVADLSDEMWNHGWTVSTINECMTKKKRNGIIKDFLLNTRVLITTRIHVRGLVDVFDKVRFVVNFHNMFPDEYIEHLGWFGEVATSISFAESGYWRFLYDIQEKHNIVFDRLKPFEFQANNMLKSLEARKTNVLNKLRRHFIYNVVDEEGGTQELVRMYDELTVARKSFVFVNSMEKVSQLVQIMEEEFDESRILVCTTNSHNLEEMMNNTNSSLPFVFVIADDELKKIKVVKVPFVLNYDVPSEEEDYNLRFDWCKRNGGVVVHFGTWTNWFLILDMQTKHEVFLTPLIVDFLNQEEISGQQ